MVLVEKCRRQDDKVEGYFEGTSFQTSSSGLEMLSGNGDGTRLKRIGGKSVKRS